MAEIQKQIESKDSNNIPTKESTLNILLKKIKETQNPSEKEKLLDKATDMIIDLANLDDIYSKQKLNIKNDTKNLIKYSLSNRLNAHL
jgi:hypothetical protein